MDEALLIERCREGEARAQRLLYEAYAEALLPLCLRYLRTLPEAEDALLRGFYQFFKTIGRFEYRGAGSVRAYLHKLMVHECLMRLRQSPAFLSSEEPDPEEADTGADVFSGLGAKEIFQHITRLPDGYRTVFNLYAVEGFTHAQIATELGISEGTSKSQLSKAKALLRQLILQTDKTYASR